MNELQELLLEELADIYDAENQLLKALPKMAKAANSPALKEAFESHRDETQEQIQRLNKVFEAFDKTAKGKACEGMKGLVEEGAEMMEDWKDSSGLDAALISAAQKVEHYEIASYGCLCEWAKLLENSTALKLLKQNMAEEEATDEKLSSLAEECNQAAIEGEAAEEEQESQSAGRAGSQLRE